MNSVLTEDEVRSVALDSSPGKNAVVKGFTIAPASDKPAGFMGDHYRLTVHVDENGAERKTSFFIKAVPKGNPQQLAYVVDTGAFEKEVQAYTRLFKHVKQANGLEGNRWHPRLCYSRPDVLVMEDLSQEGFRLAPEDKPLDMDHVLVALRTMAHMHGQCLALEENGARGATIGEMYPAVVEETIYREDKPESAFTKWMVEAFPKFPRITELIAGYSEPERAEIRTKLPRLLNEVFDLTKRSTRFRNCFNQGDGWVNNMMFRYDAGRPVEGRLVDYQFGRYLPVTHDVMEVFCMTTTREFRVNHEHTLQEFYYSELSKELARFQLDLSTLIPWAEYAQSWEHYRKLGLLRASIILQVVLTPADITEKLAPEDYDDFMLKKRFEYVERCFQYPSYKQRITEIYKEIIERYIL